MSSCLQPAAIGGKPRKHKSKRRMMHKRSARGSVKGSMSKTHPGEKNYTVKASSKNFNRGGHWQHHAQGSKVVRRPYHMRKQTKRHGKKGHSKRR